MANCTFYKLNLANSTNSFVFTTALTASAAYLYDENDSTKLTSVASSDTAAEVWQFEFTGVQTVTGIHLANHNFKSFNVKYWSSTAYVDFSTPIDVSDNTATAYHYLDSYDAVTTSKIQISATTTMAADMQKSMGGLRILNSIGEISVNPKKAKIKYHENAKKYYTDSKENVFVLFGVSTKFDLAWTNLPAADIEILEDCKYLGESFYVYLSGGDSDYTTRGWRIQDITLVNYTNAFEPKTSDNLLANGEDIKVRLEGVKTRSI